MHFELTMVDIDQLLLSYLEHSNWQMLLKDVSNLVDKILTTQATSMTFSACIWYWLDRKNGVF